MPQGLGVVNIPQQIHMAAVHADPLTGTQRIFLMFFQNGAAVRLDLTALLSGRIIAKVRTDQLPLRIPRHDVIIGGRAADHGRESIFLNGIGRASAHIFRHLTGDHGDIAAVLYILKGLGKVQNYLLCQIFHILQTFFFQKAEGGIALPNRDHADGQRQHQKENQGQLGRKTQILPRLNHNCSPFHF